MIRLLSDIHFGDRTCRLDSLSQLDPLFAGPHQVVVNGDATDTRRGPYPERTAALRREVVAYLEGRRAILMTGNHDPDISALHWQELAGGRVLVVHGDMLFDDITPWGRDAPEARRLIRAGRARLQAAGADTLEAECALFREVAAQFLQRHQVETNLWRFLRSFVTDTFWPPTRGLKVIKAWRDAPRLAADFARRFRPQAQFIVIGHLHLPGVWENAGSCTVINTGAFCRPFSAWLVDIEGSQIEVRRTRRLGGAYHPGEVVRRFSIHDPGSRSRP